MNIFYLQACLFLILMGSLRQICANQVFEEYYSEGEPYCDEICEGKNETKCYQQQLDFYNYKLVKSLFNFGKTAIYARLWVTRSNETFDGKQDVLLFSKVFNETLAEYNDKEVLGNINYDQLVEIVTMIYKKMDDATQTPISYADYPSLKCPIPCTYELITWQTLLGLSVAIFVLALTTTTIYSVYLHKQYSILKIRLKSIKYTKILVPDAEK